MSASQIPSSASVIKDLQAIVGEDKVRSDAEILLSHGRDGYVTGGTNCVHPVIGYNNAEGRTVAEVQAIVKLANTLEFAIVPSGGRTGLSGGAVAANGEVVVSFDYMSHISDFDPIDRTVVCQAGVITEQLQDFAEDRGLFYPVDFASAGSSQIGGNIATNAGGIKVIRYGMTRDWVAGLKVVTGNGDLLELNRGLLKNNAGYDLRQLFIGAEGTLGLIVEATMQLTRQPKNLTAFVLGVEDFNGIMNLFNRFQAEMDLTAFEFFSEWPTVKCRGPLSRSARITLCWNSSVLTMR